MAKIQFVSAVTSKATTGPLRHFTGATLHVL